MDLQDLMPELEAIFRFSRFAGPRQWVTSLPNLPAHGEAATLYRQEARRLASVLERLTPHLVESSQTQLLERLIKETKGELFQALCRTLASLACAAALPALLDQYTQAGAGAKLAILDLIRATGALEGYETALTQAEARSDTDAAEGLGSAAEAALTAIRQHHPGLRAVDLLAAGEPPDWETTTPDEVTGILLQAAPLDTALRALRHLAASHTTVAEAIRIRLVPLMPRERRPGAELPLAKRAALLLASQTWQLDHDVASTTLDFVIKAPAEHRLPLLKLAPPDAAARVLAHGLTGAPKYVRQSLDDLRRHLPAEILARVTGPLKHAARSTDPDIREQATAFLARAGAQVGGVDADLSSLLQPSATGTKHLSTLFQSERGRQAIAAALLDQQQWQHLAGLLAGDRDRAKADALYATLAQSLESWRLMDLQRLRWLLQQSALAGPDVLGASIPFIARALAAQISFAPDETVQLLTRDLQRLSLPAEHWGALYCEAIRSAPTQRLTALLDLVREQHVDLQECLLHEFAAVQQRTAILLDELANQPAPPGWLSEDPAGRFAADLAGAQVDAMRSQAEAMARRYLAEHRDDQRAQSQRAARLLKKLDQTLAAGAGQFEARVLDELQRSLLELSSEIYRGIDEPAPSLPQLPPAGGDPIQAFMQVRVIQRMVHSLVTSRPATVRIRIAHDAGRPIRRMLMALQDSPLRKSVSDLLTEWIAALDLHLIEPKLGTSLSAVHPQRHELLMGTTAARNYAVAVWGYAQADGTVIRPALLAPATTN